jgi:aryl-alcohol dehydrogenase-like predicted oxidoreductase
LFYPKLTVPVEDAVAALDIQLSAEDIQALEAPYVPHPVLGMM